ncbi:2-C-methyl-D-erythritol 2,4-cyclodiphosphate synthase [Thermoflavifilum aggregans]|uniref:2-C-methyl-D-erythritol 2,4-cyclodiphosphate synthase n=1 Tax=Thermoflavifilum aggregans TaxID=454188 RepID=A0A2M9CT80_9BACT|nr:2-C-methyl-D-erythritol 2,4-cyclodiphosphate synthase [Thermoflavifilum aggregans]MBX6379281.1 2-C-methyl-D-erythritol 2,4-cyclodiphosphate synthase [Thermoflavifilum aggregans]PJJ75055.1 2-C-methyl-D-erythritol 2,4-cyclodiphosphate synthase [Thermoflavifilum aggregans]
MPHFRIGQGIDFHQLSADISGGLRLGGITLPSSKGAVGHSDADALLHAICDALLGAAALGDIGTHFPDTDPTWKGADSRKLLQQSVHMVLNLGYEVCNVDCTVCLQAPKIKPYIPAMQQEIARIVQIQPDQVSIKATTTEHLGFIGREEGIAAMAVVLLMKA